MKLFYVQILAACSLLLCGCGHHPLTDYRPLVAAGMWSGSIEQLKRLDISDAEVAQVLKLKQAGVSDDTCMALVAAAHARKHPFASAESAANLAGAGYGEPTILEIARADKLDALSEDAVMLRLIGLSDSAVQEILQRRLRGMPTLSSAEISRLKNTGLSENEILDRIRQGMTDEEADREIAARQSARDHLGSGFVHLHGRRSR